MYEKIKILIFVFLLSSINQCFTQVVEVKEIKKLTEEFKNNYAKDALLAKSAALEAFKLSEKLESNAKDSLIGECANNLGVAYEISGMFDSAVWYYIHAEKKAELTNNFILEQKVQNNLGIVYFANKDYFKAHEYFKKSAEICLNQKDIENAFISLKNLMGVSIQLNDRDLFWSTISYADSVCNLYNREDFKNEIEESKMVFLANEKPEEAIEYFKGQIQNLKNNKKINSLSLSTTYRNLAIIYLNLEKPELAISVLDSALYYGRMSGSLDERKKSLTIKIKADIELYNKEEAINDFNTLNLLLDSAAKISSTNAIAEMQTKYETEKKEKENELLKKENELNELENETRKKQLGYLLFGLILASVLVLLIFNRFRITTKQKKEIEQQKSLIEAEKKEVEIQKKKTEEQKAIVEEKNHEIMASINYAKRIQTAILKEEQHVTTTFPEHFIQFIPKDVVSGDFYWALEKENHIYITVADCTGHGVPGAFMSMLGISFLNEINNTNNILTPGEILDVLRQKIIKELGQTGDISGSKDGMDVSMVRINYEKNEIVWAGANNPLYYIINEELFELKGDRQPVGYSDHQKPFTDHKLELKKGMCLYLFSDGFQDQFGGPKGKKYKVKNLKDKFLEIHKLPVEKQKELLTKEFIEWRGDIEQIDDVCVIGVRV